jgi:hypothetical protein
MKKLILVAVLLLSVSALSFAQSTTANITANVNATLSIARNNDLTIGNVNQGGTVTIPSVNAAAAYFTVTGATNATTTVTVGYPATLAGPGANTMTYTPEYPTSHTIAGAAGRVAATAFSLYSGGNALTNGTGNLYIWVGGGATATAAQAAGSYTGTLTVGVTQP